MVGETYKEEIMVKLTGQTYNRGYLVSSFNGIATWDRKSDIPKRYRGRAVKLTSRFWSAWGVSQFPTMLQGEYTVLGVDDIVTHD